MASTRMPPCLLSMHLATPPPSTRTRPPAPRKWITMPWCTVPWIMLRWITASRLMARCSMGTVPTRPLRITIMTSRFSRPTLLALAVSLGTLTAGTANAAEPMDHAAMGHAAIPAVQPAPMDVIDHSQMNLGASEQPPATTSRTPIPVLTDADREADRKSTRLNSSHSQISYSFFFFNDPATTESYTLSLHDALPI